MPAFTLPLALGIAQTLGGALSNPKLKEEDKARISGSTAEATQRSRGLANASVAPGTEEAETRVRQTQADTLGHARLMFKDPTKIASVLSGSNVSALRQGQEIDASSKRFRAQADANLVGQLARQGAEEERVQQENWRREQQQVTAKRNLLGAGAENLLGANREKVMGGFLEKMYGVDLSGGGIFDGLFGGGGGGGGGSKSSSSSSKSPLPLPEDISQFMRIFNGG